MDEELSLALAGYSSRRNKGRLEQMIADRAGIEGYQVCVELSSQSSLRSMASIGKTDVAILDRDGRMFNLSKISPMAKSLQSRDPFGWSVAV